MLFYLMLLNQHSMNYVIIMKGRIVLSRSALKSI